MAAKHFTTNTTLTDELPMMQTIDSKLHMGTIRHGRFNQSDGADYIQNTGQMSVDDKNPNAT